MKVVTPRGCGRTPSGDEGHRGAQHLARNTHGACSRDECVSGRHRIIFHCRPWTKENTVEEFRLGDQIIRHDRAATVAAYNAVPLGDADRCRCAHCRNFAAQRATVYPLDFRALLEQLGIDPNKEGEVYDVAGPFELSVRLTGGWFYFVGELIEKGERLTQSGDFQYWFQPSFPRPPACFGECVAAVEFAAKIPWVLDESSAG